MNEMNYEKETLEFYDQIVNDFASRTVSADMSEEQGWFTACLPEGALILDLGCGSGRDTKAFLEAGYRVEAVDGSEEMCRAASAYNGIPVKRMLFEELEDEVNRCLQSSKDVGEQWTQISGLYNHFTTQKNIYKTLFEDHFMETYRQVRDAYDKSRSRNQKKS